MLMEPNKRLRIKKKKCFLKAKTGVGWGWQPHAVFTTGGGLLTMVAVKAGRGTVNGILALTHTK